MSDNQIQTRFSCYKHKKHTKITLKKILLIFYEDPSPMFYDRLFYRFIMLLNIDFFIVFYTSDTSSRCNLTMQLNLEIRANVSTFIVSTCILRRPRRLVSPPRRSPFTRFTGRRHAVHNGTRWRRRSPVSRSSVRPMCCGLSNVSSSLEDIREGNRIAIRLRYDAAIFAWF